MEAAGEAERRLPDVQGYGAISDSASGGAGAPSALDAMTPEERVQKAIEYGSQIHPQYKEEFDNGVAVAWHRSPFTMGCYGMWNADSRARHYDDLCQNDNRIVLAGEHASFIGGWQEGAVTSALDAIGRLHARVVARGATA